VNYTSLRWGLISALLATLIWSWNFIIARSVIETVAPVTLALLRWTAATLLLLPFSWKPLRRSWPLVRHNLPYLLTTALLGVTLFNTLVYIASQTSPAVNLSLIAITFPIFIVLFSALFLHQPITLRRSAGILLVLLGVALLGSAGSIQQLRSLQLSQGDLWMLLAAVIFAIYSILVRYKPEGLESRAFLIYTFLPGWILLLPWALWEQLSAPWPTITPGIAASILYLGLFTSILSYLLWNHAVATIGPSNAGMIYYTLPLFSAVEAWLVLGEAITRVHLISAATIISGIYLSTEQR
jgi:drug/metabolite transporter (DMT)-like permease